MYAVLRKGCGFGLMALDHLTDHVSRHLQLSSAAWFRHTWPTASSAETRETLHVSNPARLVARNMSRRSPTEVLGFRVLPVSLELDFYPSAKGVVIALAQHSGFFTSFANF
jgi:hypothetical protein